MVATMRAWTSAEGTPLTLTDRPVPTPGPQEVLVRTRAVALNNADLAASGEAHVAGFEFAGDVLEVGADAPAHLQGARVMGIAAGAFAEVVIAHHRHVVVVPQALSYEDAAALPTAMTTEYGALALAGAGPGTSLLLTAATSGLGLIGIQVAKALGAGLVVATTRSPHKRHLLERVGADTVLVIPPDDLVGAVRKATEGEGASVVLDHVGGPGLGAAVEAARDGGTVISVGRLGGARADIDLFALARRHVLLRSVSYGLTPPHVLGDLFDGLAATVLPAVTAGRICAVLDRSYAFEAAVDAFSRLASGDAEGKVVLRLS